MKMVLPKGSGRYRGLAFLFGRKGFVYPEYELFIRQVCQNV